MKLYAISEADITRTNVGRVGREVGKSAIDTIGSAVPGADLATKVGKLTYQIYQLIKTKRDATKLIAKAMSLPDSDRPELNIFDVDDNIWGPDGLLNDRSKLEIIKIVKQTVDEYVDQQKTIPANFANNIAISYIKSKIKLG